MTDNTAIIGTKVPNFSLITTNSKETTLSDYTGKKLILFFYPKDNTPVCTSEAKAFRDHYQQFTHLNTTILGISRDSLNSHVRFKERLELPFDLISDCSEEVCNFFDVIKDKNFFGKKIKGIVRSTFLLDESQILLQEWRKIKLRGHIDEILQVLGSSAHDKKLSSPASSRDDGE